MQTRVLWAVCVLAALCAAQDVFSDVNNTVVNNARVFSGDTTNDLSFNTLAVVNGHTYVLMGIRKDSTDSALSQSVPDRVTHAALVDLTANKSVRLVDESAGNVLPVTLCSDGTHLYALLATDATPLRDAFGEIAAAAGVIYKVAADLTLVDRLHSPSTVGAACAAAAQASPLFMLRAYSKTGDTEVKLYDTSNAAIDMGTCERGTTNPGKQGSGCIVLAKDLFGRERSWTVLPLNMTAMYASGSIAPTETPDRFVAAIRTDNVVSETESFTDHSVLGVLLIDTATPPKVVDYKLLDTGSERRTVDPVPALTRINATTLALFTLAYDAVTVGGATCARGDTVAAAVELTATTVAVTRAQCHTLGYTSTSFQPAALDRPFDGKLLAVMPYNGFGTEYCGTTLYATGTSDSSTAQSMAMVSLDPATLACVSATPLSTTGGVWARGLVAAPDNDDSAGQLLLTETRAGFECRVRVLSYVRCDDGVVDPADGRCVCFVGGKHCTARRAPAPSSASTSTSTSTSVSSLQPMPPTSDDGSDDAPGVRTIVAITLLALTGVLLVLTIVFIALFAASK